MPGCRPWQCIVETAGDLVAARDVKVEDAVTKGLAGCIASEVGLLLRTAPLVDQQHTVFRQLLAAASEKSTPLLGSVYSLCEVEVDKDQVMDCIVPLDESLDEFKRGVELTRQCQDVLDKAQLSVEQLMNVDDEASGEPFEPES